MEDTKSVNLLKEDFEVALENCRMLHSLGETDKLLEAVNQMKIAMKALELKGIKIKNKDAMFYVGIAWIEENKK